MANSVTHTFTPSAPQGSDPTKVRKNNWTANHLISIDTTKAHSSTPASPAVRDVWWEVTGTSPNEVWELKGVGPNGDIRVLDSQTF